MAKYLSGRVQRIPQSGLTSDRYNYLSLDQAEPNLGDPVIPGVALPAGAQYQSVSIVGYPGERYWVPVSGGLIPGSISVYNEGLLVPPGGVSSITQLNFVGAAISASGYLDSYGNPGTISTITVFAPGNNKELIFNSNNEFSSSVDLTYDANTGILTAARILNVGAGGTVISTTGIGSVGIGTTNPTAKLHIVGDLRLTGTIYDYLNNPGTTQQILVKNALGSLVWTSQGSIEAGAGGTYTQIQYHNSAGLVDGAVNFVYDPINNRVGIGSTLPTYLLDVAGDTRITGIATLNKLYVTGISTFSSSVDSTNATSGALIISGGVGIAKNLNVGTVVSAVSLTVTGQTTTQNLNVVGVSSLFDINGTSANFTGIITGSTFKGQISSGVGTITTFNSTNGTITALTGTAVTYTTGNITTLNGSDVYYNAGIVTTLTSTNSSLANIISSGISTLGITTTTQLTARSLNVSGITTTQTLNVSSTSTFGGSITPSATTTYDIGSINYKWNSLYVSTIVADTITGNTTTATSVIGGIADITSSNVSGISTTQSLIVSGNSTLGIATATSLSSQSLSVAGVATVPTLNSTSGNITTLNGSNLYYNVGVVTTLSGTNLSYNSLTGTAATITTGNIATLSGSNAYYNTGIVTTLSGTNLTYTNGNVSSLVGTEITYTNANFTNLSGGTITYSTTSSVTLSAFNGYINTGIVTTLSGNSLTYPIGNITSLISQSINVTGVITATTFKGALNGNADTATKLATARTIAITGDLAYTSPSFDGTTNVTAIGTLADTGVAAAFYGSTTTIPRIEVDAKGRIISASSVGVNFTAATVAQADKLTTGRTIAITGDLEYTSPSFDGTTNVTAIGTLKSTGVAAATYGSGSQVPVFDVDIKGRITSVYNTSITGINASSVAAAGSNTQIQFNDSNVFAGNANLTFNKVTNTFATSTITANSITIAGDGSALYGPNSTWGQYLRIGGNGNADTTNASVVATNGNLHIDAKTGAFATYINYYKGTSGVYFGNGAGDIVGSVDSSGNSSFRTIASTVATGTAPLTVTSTTQVSNLNSNYLNGITATQLFNNMGINHTTRSDFNSSTNFGFNYIQGTTNGPGIPSAMQYYNLSIGIGNDYAYSQYAMEFAIPRTSVGGLPYPSVRFRDGGTWGSWSKIYAGFADSATSATSATYLNASNYILRRGSSGNYNTDFQNTPAGSMSHQGDDYSSTNGPGGWWFIDNYRHSNISNYWGTQVAWGWEDNANRLATRNIQNGTFGSWVYYLNSSNYTSYSPSLTGSGASGTWGINVTGSSASCTGNSATATTASSCSGNSATATNLTGDGSNWSTNGRLTAVVGQLSWKNYGNRHTIFDASASTSPDGGAVNNTNSQVAWTGSFPTLMGWNGSNTFGVRVDSARISDSTSGSSASCTGNAATATTADALTTGNNYQVNSFGVGTAASGTAGEIRATNNITAYYSDERLKENITTISDALSKVLTLRGVTFNSNEIAEQYGYTDKKEQVGVIAQDVEKVLPQVVVPAPFDIAQDEDGNEYSKSGENYKTVDYPKLTALLIEAVKSQQEIIVDLQNRVKKLENM